MDLNFERASCKKEAPFIVHLPSFADWTQHDGSYPVFLLLAKGGSSSLVLILAGGERKEVDMMELELDKSGNAGLAKMFAVLLFGSLVLFFFCLLFGQRILVRCQPSSRFDLICHV